MNTNSTITALLTTLVLAVPGAASAATRYASPTGTGPVATCAEANPCDLQDAFEYTRVRDGDEIVLAPGDYPDSGGVGVDKAVSIHGTAGGKPPVIHETGDTAFYLDDPGLTIADIEIDHTGPGGYGLFIRQGNVERLSVSSAGSTACFAANATIRDSVCVTDDSAALMSGFANPIDYTLRLRNVTAVSTGPFGGSSGLYVDNAQGGHATVDAKNVIAFAQAPAAPDVYASGGSGGAFSHITLEASNYDSVLAANGGTVTDPGSGNNQTDVPVFTDLAAGKLTQAPASPTIDGGIADQYTGTVDLAGNPRQHGSAIDIGAYEFEPAPPPVEEPPVEPTPPPVAATPPPVDQTPPPTGETPPPADETASAPETTITKAPKPRTRKRMARFEFSATAGGAGFECSLDGGAFAPCGSPLGVRVRAGRHTLLVRALGTAGKADATPAEARWKVKRRR